jgi:hypothetical protein
MVDNKAHYQPSNWLLEEMIFLELKCLEEVNKYFFSLPSTILLIELISVERMDSAFLGVLLAPCSLFKLQLPFEWINFFKKEKNSQIILSRS